MKGLLVALLIFGWVPVAFFKPQIGVLLWSWVSHMAPQAYTYNFARSFPFLVLVTAVTLVAMVLGREKGKLPGHPLIIALFVYWVWVVITTLLAFEPTYAQDKLIKLSKILFFAVISTVVMQSPIRLKGFLWVMVASLMFVSVKGGIFTIMTGGAAHVQGAGGMMGDNNQLAMAMCMLLPLAIYMAQYPPAPLLKWPLIISAILVPISVLGTQSRGGLAALSAVTFMLILKTKRKFSILIVIAVLGSAGFAFMPDSWKDRMETTESATDDDSFLGRVSMWKFSTNLADDRPVQGGGFDVFYIRRAAELYMPPGYEARAPHSIYFEVLGEHGYVGLLLFLTLIFSGWYIGGGQAKRYRAYEETKWIGDLCAATQLSIVGFAAGGITVNIATFDVFYHILAVIVMCSVVGERILEGDVTPVQKTGLFGAKQKAKAVDNKGQTTQGGGWQPSRPSSAQAERF